MFGSWRVPQVCLTNLGRDLVPGEGSRFVYRSWVGVWFLQGQQVRLTTLDRGLVPAGAQVRLTTLGRGLVPAGAAGSFDDLG